MGKIERRVLAAALLGAVAMFGVVGFTRGEHRGRRRRGCRSPWIPTIE